MAKKEKPPEPNLSELPMNNDEAAAVSNLLESAEKASDLGEKELAKLCLKEAGYILRRGRQEPGQLIKLVPSNATRPDGAAPATLIRPAFRPQDQSPPLSPASPGAPSIPVQDAPPESAPPKTTGQ